VRHHGPVLAMSHDAGRYELIGVDQMEATIVRRLLHPWNDSDAARIYPILRALEAYDVLPVGRIKRPRWELTVYPLCYLAGTAGANAEERRVDYVYDALRSAVGASEYDAGNLRAQINSVVNCEIDVLIEDESYFVLLEVKILSPGQRRVKFGRCNKTGLHQLVRQYVQGRLLERLTGKSFVLATVGANGGRPFEVVLTHDEVALVSLVTTTKTDRLRIVDVQWSEAWRDGVEGSSAVDP